MEPIYVLGTGSFVPEQVLTNTDLEKKIDTTGEWIFKRTGIRERRIAAPDQAASDLALPACRAALDTAGLTPQDIELIIMATITPDMACPAGANWLQAKLDAPQALTFDIAAACSGFIFALLTAQQYLVAGFCQNALVVASEVMSRTVNWEDVSSSILWGDGAGAAVLSLDNDQGHRLLSTHAHTDGANGQNLLLPGAGSRTTPVSHESVNQHLHSLRMIDANSTLRVAVKYFAESCYEAVKANGVSIEDVNWFIPHQANQRIIQALAKRLNVAMDHFYLTIGKYGNSSSASLAIAFDEAVRTGAVKKNDLVCLTSFGGGLTWASSLIKW
ncbi:MAG: ketoacyl-ACP synthase III [Deltaproteobacteria bacterium]|nr:ketoacyl-ACP synthase III [Deltaproteobacteria bacterium]